MDKYNKKNWLVFFFARHFYTGNGKRHGLAPAPVRRGTMAEKDRKGGGGLTGAAGRTTKADRASSAAARPTFVEDQGVVWTAKELRAQDSSGFHGGATAAREL
jgi:hypothetical protein